MDVVMLSRLQFAVAVFFHFIFVPLTLGLSIILAWMETRYVRTGDVFWKNQAKFWGKLFLINFTLGVVTGITLEFQFGTNWSRYSEYVGDIFGSLLAIEATVAFFLESTFLAVWHFGWERVGKKMHLAAIYIVAFAGNLSALWIILANGFMQNPVGYAINESMGRAELSNFWDVVFNGYAWGMYAHTVIASWALGGFFVLGVSAWHLLRGSHKEFFQRSFRMAAPFTLIMVLLLALSGDQQGKTVAHYQPAKLAALESHWETGRNAPFYLLAWPDEANEGNKVQALGIPGLLSWIAYGDANAEVKGLKDFAVQDRPPVLPTFLSFRLMVGLGGIFVLLSFGAFWQRRRDQPCSGLLKALVWNIPLPYIGIMAGWAVAEIGRQPWIVYNLMRTSDAVSPLPADSVVVSLAAFIVVYSLLGILDIYLLRKYAIKGPEAQEV
ncbi:cytochrome ubiquinol oxidase subunit I [Desulfovibrio legallii]|uniref:Cytochrome bd-I ubiquinol oxidase subunit 1 apoprotein n=1 Tax=Desulfovibrio legallii TaxID=571438 RepID=A0A1G7IQ32_9BACT|nr:cytochrome ubiquinol oxidase subunit I [Desulfovibrio legallii]SDF14419.1 cytochrome bd-I ubiquinol oxidase subunit 1 apoprotein [Desulfovibrio legallii]